MRFIIARKYLPSCPSVSFRHVTSYEKCYRRNNRSAIIQATCYFCAKVSYLYFIFDYSVKQDDINDYNFRYSDTYGTESEISYRKFLDIAHSVDDSHVFYSIFVELENRDKNSTKSVSQFTTGSLIKFKNNILNYQVWIIFANCFQEVIVTSMWNLFKNVIEKTL